MNWYLLIINIFLPSIILLGQDKNTNQLKLNFIHKIDSHSLVLDSSIYINNVDQLYSITKFKYYISNIQLINEQEGKSTVNNDVFLVDEEVPSSKEVSISKIPNGEYSQLGFILGVDSLRNCSGAQSGALDPIHAMFWTWNSGYIFLKLEGQSTSSKAPGGIFEYHIGGYKAPVNCIQHIHLKFKSPLKFSNQSIHHLNIHVNISEIFKTPVDINFGILPSVTDLKNALMISNNYKDMFSIK